MTSKYTNKNGVKLLATIMVLAMAFAGCVVLCEGDSQTDAAVSSDTTYISGTMSASQTYESGSKVVVNGNLTIQNNVELKIKSGASLTVNEGVTITVASAASASAGKITIDDGANVVVKGIIILKTGVVAASLDNSAGAPTNTTGFKLDGSIILERKATITGTNGQILLNDGSSISMQSVKDNVSEINNQTLLVTAGAKVDFNGKVNTVTVASYYSGTFTQGSVTFNDSNTEILKLSFTTVNEKIDLAFSTSGGIVKIKNAVDAVLLVSGSVPSGYVFTVKANESTGLFYPNAEGTQGLTVPMKGIVRIVDNSDLKVQSGAKIVSEEWSVLEVDGSLSINGISGTDAEITLDGLMYVSGIVDSGKYSVMTASPKGYVIIEGEGSVTFAYDLSSDVNVFGGLYNDVTNHVTVVKNIYQIIDEAVAEGIANVTVSSTAEVGSHLSATDLLISENLVVPGDVSLKVIGKVVVDAGVCLEFGIGSIQTFASGEISVKGELIDYNTYSYTNAQIKADVCSVDYDYTYYKYTTLSNALEGDETEIEIFALAVVLENDLTIPVGYTVKVADGTTITVGQDLVLTVDGKVEVGDKDCILSTGDDGRKGKVVVNGEIKSDVAFTSIEKAYIFGAYWEASPVKITSIEVAAENTSRITQIDVYGDAIVGDLVFETDGTCAVTFYGKLAADSITMNGASLTLTAESVIGTINLDGTSLIFTGGMLTATVVAPQGTSSQAVMALDKAKGVIVSSSTEVDDVKTYKVQMNTITEGTFEIADGIVTINDSGVDAGSAIIVDADAELQVMEGENFVIGSKAKLVVNGTLRVEGTFMLSSSAYNDVPVINGSLIAEKGSVKVNSLVVLGNVEVADAVNFVITGNGVVIGSISDVGNTASVSGKVDSFTGNLFIKVYAGADISDLTITSKVAKFYVNEVLFATVLFVGDVTYANAVSVNEINDIPGVKPFSGVTIPWTYKNGTSIPAGNMTDGIEAYYVMSPLEIDVRFSVETGTQIQIGPDFYSSTTTASIPYVAGKYPVVAKALQGYTGTAVVELWVDNVNMGIQDGIVELTVDMVGKQVVIVSKFSDTPTPGPTPVDPSKEVIVSTSVVDGKVIVSVISLDGGYLVAGTEVEVTFTTLVETTAFGQTVYKPTPVTETITIGDDKPTISNNAYELADILGDKYAVINVVSTIGTTGYGSMSLNYKG